MSLFGTTTLGYFILFPEGFIVYFCSNAEIFLEDDRDVSEWSEGVLEVRAFVHIFRYFG